MKVNEEARNKLFVAINGLTDRELNEKPSNDIWSIKQILEHLYLMEGVIIKTIESELQTGNRKETSDKPIERTVDRSIIVKAPEFAQPSDDFKTLKELKIKLSVTHNLLKKISKDIPIEELEK